MLHPGVVIAEQLRVVAHPNEGPPSEASKELLREARRGLRAEMD